MEAQTPHRVHLSHMAQLHVENLNALIGSSISARMELGASATSALSPKALVGSVISDHSYAINRIPFFLSRGFPYVSIHGSYRHLEVLVEFGCGS